MLVVRDQHVQFHTCFPDKAAVFFHQSYQISFLNYPYSTMDSIEVDGVFAWIIAIVASVINLIAGGLPHTYGLIFVELLEAFGPDESLMSIPGNLLISISFLTGKW